MELAVGSSLVGACCGDLAMWCSLLGAHCGELASVGSSLW